MIDAEVHKKEYDLSSYFQPLFFLQGLLKHYISRASPFTMYILNFSNDTGSAPLSVLADQVAKSYSHVFKRTENDR